MDDSRIVDLYWERNESALTKTAEKYGKFCFSVAYNILNNHEDSEEHANDTYLEAWEAIPPQRPNLLPAFLAKITRNNAINRVRFLNRKKGGAVKLIFCFPNWRIAYHQISLQRINLTKHM